ncbi:MAG: sigma-70 family RNA polymerase sigma factor [Clostridiales bacterium]|nr:sigma-70 family RNA polymerase sigma factor [Clostridiales bacterium]
MPNGDEKGRPLAQSSKETWDALYEQYYEILFQYCLSRLGRNEDAAAECVHRTFEITLKKIKSLRDHPNIGGWLMNTVKHQVAKYHDKTRRDILLFRQMAANMAHETLLGRPMDSDLDVEAFLARLSESERVLYERYYVHEEKAKEIALSLGVSEAAVWMRLSRLRTKMQKEYNFIEMQC